ncbi:31411_t:CDS:2, partial [Gigaspora margarita]
EPVWIELAGHLLIFALSNNADALNKWLFSDILLSCELSRWLSVLSEIFLKQTELDFKCEALDILPVSLNSVMPTEKITNLVEQEILDVFLKAMVRSDSVNLFKILVPIFVREHDHIYSEEFYRKLREFVSKLPRSKFVERK